MHYYPVETIAAMLNSMMGSSEKVAHYINFAESQGIQVLPPNINESYSKFTVQDDKIRFGLAAIKNVGMNVVDSIVEARDSKGKFESITDFINKTLKVMTSTTIQKIYDCKEAHNEGIDHEEYSIHDEDKVVVGGIITEVTQKVTRNNQIMAFIKIEDLSATIEVIVFPKTLDRVRNLIAADAFVIIKGRVSMKEDEAVKIICETVEPLEKVNSSKVYVRVDNLDMARASKPKLMEIATEYAGDTPLYVFTANDRKNYRMPRNMWVNLSSDIFVELEKVFGEGNVKIVE